MVAKGRVFPIVCDQASPVLQGLLEEAEATGTRATVQGEGTLNNSNRYLIYTQNHREGGGGETFELVNPRRHCTLDVHLTLRKIV